MYHNFTFDHNILWEKITESSFQSCAAVLFSNLSLLSFIMLFNYCWEWSEQVSLVYLTLLHITSSGILIVLGQLVFPWAALPTSARASSAAVKCFLISNQVFQVWRRKQEDNIKDCILLQVAWFCCGCKKKKKNTLWLLWQEVCEWRWTSKHIVFTITHTWEQSGWCDCNLCHC